MKEIPVSYVRANQVGIILFILAAVSLKQPLILLALWLIQFAGLILGPRANLFIIVIKPFLNIDQEETQSGELQRFNNILGLFFLTASLVSFGLGFKVAGYGFAGAFALAAFIAFLGFCVGCTIYYQFKRLFKNELKPNKEGNA